MNAWRLSVDRLWSVWRSIRLTLARANAVFAIHHDYAVEYPESLHDPQRHERISAFLHDSGLLRRRDVFVPRSVSVRKLRLAHDDAYLDSLQSADAFVPVLGFRPDDALLERTLRAQRLATGGTVLATDLAWRTRGLAVNLGGGFHHAERDRGQGFCVFNDIAVAVRNWSNAHGGGSALVIDLDLHDGDGTRAIFRDDPDVFTLSIHNRDLGDPDATASKSLALGDGVGDAAYLEAVRRLVPEIVRQVRPDLVFFLAGCDPAADDRLGNWRISADGMLERDRVVLEALRERDRPIPTVVVLAGGYGTGAWRYSARSLSSILTGGRALDPPSTEQLTLSRFRSLYRRIHPDDLSREPATDDPWRLSPDDVAPALGGPPRSRYLDFYTRHGIEVAMERYGLLDRVRALGLRRLRIDLDLDAVAGDTVRLISRDWPDQPLIELRARRDSTRIPGTTLLSVEWLLLQNPSIAFSGSRPALPGQRHPGLGLLRETFAVLVLICERLGLDGIVIVAGHYHLVALSSDLLRFLDPSDRSRFQAMRRALESVSMARASVLVERGALRDTATGAPVEWRPVPMVLPIHDRLRDWLDLRENEWRERSDEQPPRYTVVSGRDRPLPMA